MQDLHKVNLSQLRACDQQWGSMKRVGDKRLCAKCDKHITDFRRMSSREIALTHAKSETAVCGLYRPDQLSKANSRAAKNSLIPVASFVSLLSFLSPNQGQGQNTELETPIEQTPIAPASEAIQEEGASTISSAERDSVIIGGTATVLMENGIAEPVPFATILVKGTEIGTTTDFDGNYSLDISELPDSLGEITLIFSFIGMTRQEKIVPNKAAVNVNFDTVSHDNMIAYSVTVEKVPLHKRVWWKMTSVFR